MLPYIMRAFFWDGKGEWEVRIMYFEDTIQFSIYIENLSVIAWSSSLFAVVENEINPTNVPELENVKW